MSKKYHFKEKLRSYVPQPRRTFDITDSQNKGRHLNYKGCLPKKKYDAKCSTQIEETVLTRQSQGDNRLSNQGPDKNRKCQNANLLGEAGSSGIYHFHSTISDETLTPTWIN